MLQLNHTCDIQRNQALGTNGRKQFAALTSDVACLFLPMSRKAAVENGFEPGYVWDVYMADGTDVQTTDRLVFNGANYVVGGKQAYSGLLAPVNHIHLTVTTEKANGR